MVFPIFVQLGEMTDSVTRVGFPIAIALIFVLAFGILGKILLTYFTGRLDKKDEQLIKVQEEFSKAILQLMSDRSEDMHHVQRAIDANTHAIEANTRLMSTLAIRGEK